MINMGIRDNKIPVLFLIFDRKNVSIEAFKEIKTYQPNLLFIAGDGPRMNKDGEKERCEETRQAILEMIDWPCKVETLFRDGNLGCAKAVSTAITWFFENVEYGVIIEDDVVVSQDFFRLCEKLLRKYEKTDRVMMITSQYLDASVRSSSSYGFSNYAQIWGWATWRRGWLKMDMSMALWNQVSLTKLIKELGYFRGLMFWYYWSTAYRKVSRGEKFESWATRWALSLLAQDGLSLTPMVNLSKNIGCTGVGGAHYDVNDVDPYINLSIGSINWPIEHPDKISCTKRILKVENKDFKRVRMIGIKKKLGRIFGNLRKY